MGWWDDKDKTYMMKHMHIWQCMVIYMFDVEKGRQDSKHMIEIHGKTHDRNTWKKEQKNMKSAVLFCNHSCEGSGSLPKIVNS